MSLNFSPIANEHTIPAANPTTTAPRVLTVPQDGVIATRPATTPEAAPNVVGLPSRDLLNRKPAQHAQAAGHQGIQEDRGRQAVGSQRGSGVEPEPAEPQQPHAEQHEGQVVRAHRVDLESDAGPSTSASASAEEPETIRQPARRRNPEPRSSVASRRGAHTQCATTAYTSTDHTGTKTIQAANRARSAIAR